MADCEATLRELRTYLDSELSVEARAAVQGHLDGCLDCLQAFDFHAELREVIARKCCDELPAGLLDKIQACFGDPAEATTIDTTIDAEDGTAR